MLNKNHTKISACAIFIAIIATAFVIFCQKSPGNPDFYTSNLTLFNFDTIESPSIGNPAGEIKVIEFSSYTCDQCREVQQSILNFIQDTNLQLTHKDFPQDQVAFNAAIAARCADLQGKFWEYNQKLFDHQTEWIRNPNFRDIFRNYAKEIGIANDQFNVCLDFQATKDQIKSDVAEGKKSGIGTPPSVAVNGKFLSIPVPQNVATAITYELKNA